MSQPLNWELLPCDPKVTAELFYFVPLSYADIYKMVCGDGPQPPTPTWEALGCHFHSSSLALEARGLWPSEPRRRAGQPFPPQVNVAQPACGEYWLQNVGRVLGLGCNGPPPSCFFL